MGRNDRKKKLTGPWHNVQLAFWLIGLALLAVFNWWWPGILVLIAASVLFEAAIMRLAPQAFEEEPPVMPAPGRDVAGSASNTPAMSPSAPAVYPAHLLPSACPKCGAPLRGQDVKWIGTRSAECPFCDARIPLNKE